MDGEQVDIEFSEIAKCPHAGEVSTRTADSFGGDVLEWFRYLRREVPVFRDEKGAYVLTRYDDIYAALNDPETFSSDQELEIAEYAPANERSIVYSDDPEHLDVRKLVNKAWTPGAVIEFREAIEGQVKTLVNSLSSGVPFDAVTLGMQISQKSFAEAMGLPADEHPRIANWLVAAGAFVRPEKMMRNANRPRAGLDQRRSLYESGIPDMRSYFADVLRLYRDVDQRTLRERGVPPFPRAIVAAAKADPDNVETVITKIMPPLLAGGVSTLSHVFPNSLDVLLDRPNLWQRLRVDPDLLDLTGRSDTIEEMLRLRGVVQGMPRVTKKAVEVRGILIPAGSLVHLYYLSAGRDEDAFPEADEFHDRGMSRHLTFGFGTHTCMGQSLVRLELKIFLRALVGRFARIERVKDEVDWGGTGVYCTPDRLMAVGFDS